MRTIITGSGGGIGFAIARALAEQPGAQLVLADRNATRGEESAATLRTLGAVVRTVGGDVSDPAVAQALVTACTESYGGIDALVTAAGSIANDGRMESLPLDRYEAAFRVNTRPLFVLAQAAYPALRASKGAIVALSSTASRHPVPGLGTYSASKAALVMLARQLALEWGPEGIRVNCVAPGPTATPMAPAYADADVRARRAATLPLRRISEPEDIAAAVLFLLGAGARGITGIEIEVEGGMGLTTMELSGASLGRSKG
jgi:NAD(P)-dependent dehydrogenase (short-subunit alcohol dehydrogenase family)